MPNQLKKIGYFFLNPVQKLYWFTFRPKTRGVKCIIEHEGKILFVRLGYAHKSWTIPGGGVKKNETFEEAVRRETKEEVGIELGEIKKIGEYLNTKQYKIDTVECFSAKVSSPYFKVDGFEITEAVWADPNDPPTPDVPRVQMLMDLFKNQK